MKVTTLARVAALVIALVGISCLHDEAHAVAYPCSKAGLHQGLTAGGVITLSCTQPTTIALTEGAQYAQPIDFDGEGRVTLTNADQYGITIRAAATFKRTTFSGTAPVGRGVIIISTHALNFDRVVVHDVLAQEAATLFSIECTSNCTSRITNSTFTKVPGVFEVRTSASTLEVTNSTFDTLLTPVVTLDNAQVRARYVTLVRAALVGWHFNTGNVRYTSSIIHSNAWLFDVNGTATSGGYNVIQSAHMPAGFATGTDVVITTPLTLDLQPLANNGGPTQTIALGACSAAVNIVTDNNPTAEDQRGTGFARVKQGKPDAGAFESAHTAVPCITQQPTNATIFATQTFTLSVTANGPANRTYQWKKGNANIPGATAATYTKANAAVGDAGTYSVVVTGPGGSTPSNDVTVTVHGPPAFGTHPQNRNLAAGATLTLTAAASGQNVTYQWKKGANNINGATSATYTKTNTVVADSGAYSVVATNPAGSATSNIATVTVTNAPTITSPPTHQTLFATQTLTLSVGATDATSFQWKKGNTNIPGATAATYTKANAAVGDAGTYSVVVTGPGGSTPSNNVTVTVHGPPILVTEPQDRRLFVDQTLTLAVEAQGESLTYQWVKGGAPLEGAIAATYSAVVTEAVAGGYTVVVSNPAGSATSRTALVTVDGRATITADPEDVTLFAGQTLTLDVEADGVGLSYQWQLEGEDLVDATQATYTKVAEVEDSGSYVALVRNGAGEVASAPANVVVHGPPVIVTPPSAATVFGSTELTLSVVASGESLTYQWRKDEIAIEGATDATYRSTATLDLAGRYDVVVSNPAGSVTADAVVVVVHGPPVIVTPPSGLTALRDTNASLTVIASGEALTYRWYRDDVEVPNAAEATLSLTLNEATVGEYVVAVSNPAGTVESEPVTVALEDEPQPEPGPEAEVEPTPEESSDTDTTAEAEAETITKGSSKDGCAGGSAGLFGGLLGLALLLRARGAKP